VLYEVEGPEPEAEVKAGSLGGIPSCVIPSAVAQRTASSE
jgi:hypothetical protein